MFGFKADPIKKVRVGIIGLGNRGNTLLEMFKWLVEQEAAQIVALSDIEESKVTKAQEKLGQWQKTKPKTYFKDVDDWKNLAKQDDIDLILVTTPWEWHLITRNCWLRASQRSRYSGQVVLTNLL